LAVAVCGFGGRAKVRDNVGFTPVAVVSQLDTAELYGPAHQIRFTFNQFPTDNHRASAKLCHAALSFHPELFPQWSSFTIHKPQRQAITEIAILPGTVGVHFGASPKHGSVTALPNLARGP
jgi:hypothetical protein